MNILSINNFNIKAPLFLNKQEQNNNSVFGLKLASPLREDTISFQAGKTKNAKIVAEKAFARTKKTSGDLKNGITTERAIKFRLMHYNAHSKLLNLLTNRLGKHLSTDDKKGLITLKERLKKNFSLIQKTASLNIGHLSDEEILKLINDVSGVSFILEDPKAYGVLIKELSGMVKRGELNPVKVKYQKMPEEYKKGKLIKSNDSLNPALSSKFKETIYEIKGRKSELWGTTDSASGYSGLHIIIKNPDGKFSEIQIKVRSIADLKFVEDNDYKIMNGKELSPEYAPLEAVLRPLKPVDPNNLTESEKVLHKAMTKYSQEAYSLALEHPFQENAPFLRVVDAKSLTNKEKELIAPFDFNRIKLFQMDVDKIVDLKRIEDNYYKVMTGESLPYGYAPLETALKSLKPKDSRNLTESEKVLHKAMNKYTREAYDYAIEKTYEQDLPFLSVKDAKTLTNKEKELIAQFDFNKIKLFVDACEMANTI